MTPDLSTFVAELTHLLGHGGVLTGGERLLDYAHDESDAAPSVPAVVCFPESSSQVQAVLAGCSRHRLPVTPVGARTGKSGGSVPSAGGVGLSLERMNRIKEISVEDMVCVCEPGVLTVDLMRAVEERGLFYPPDPASLESCTIGGNIAENAGGPRALKYGVTREWVLGLEVVLASGQLMRTGRRTIKGVAGYDLTALLVGSEGTLGVVTEATLKLRPLPPQVLTALIPFSSLRGAAEAVKGVLGSGSLPRALELMDARAVQAVDGTYYRFPACTEAALLIELDGEIADSLVEEMSRLENICRGFGAGEMAVAADPAQRERLWTARRRISEAVHTIKPLKMSEDIAVPLSRIPDMIEAVQQIAARRDLVHQSDPEHDLLRHLAPRTHA